MKIYILIIVIFLFSCHQENKNETVIFSDNITIRKIDYISNKVRKSKKDVEHFFAISTDKNFADSIMIDSVDKFIVNNILDTIELKKYSHFRLQFIKDSDLMKRIKLLKNGSHNINIYSAEKKILLTYDWFGERFQNKYINNNLYFDNFDTIPPLPHN